MTVAVVAIIPAYNEAPRVGAVVRTLLMSRRFTRVLVVDDGSRDGTAEAAKIAGAHVLRLQSNRGKGGAMLAGLQATYEPIVAFFDADMVDLRPEHVAMIVGPVAAGHAVMVCGLSDYDPKYNALQLAIPPITGNRAVRRDALDRMAPEFWHGFNVEAGINTAACRFGTVLDVILPGLKSVPKWQKVGVRQGMIDAAKMTRDVLTAMGSARQMPWGASWGRQAPAGQAVGQSLPVSVDASGKIHGVDAMLDQIAAALAKQARPILRQDILPAFQADKVLQREVGAAIGRSAAKTLQGPLWLAASALAVIAVIAVVRVSR